MNILYIPQLSMYDKVTGKYTPAADGNINMMRNFINEWLIYNPEDQFFALLPSRVDVRELDIKCKYFLYSNSVVSARINRFNFPMFELQEHFKHWKFDLVINDIPELSRNILAMFEVSFGYLPKIMSNIHHMDDVYKDESKYNYHLRVFDAIECSDYVTILSESMEKMLMDNMNFYLDSTIVNQWMKKVFVFEPSVSGKELDQYKLMAIEKDMKKKIITFPGRLSPGEEKRTNWDKFYEAIIKLRNFRQDFEVYFTDPNNSGRFEGYNWIKTINKDRDEFLRLLNKTDIVVSLMNIQGFGGISIREALQFGPAPVIPYVDEYIKMHPFDFYPGFIHGGITTEKLMYCLNDMLDRESNQLFKNNIIEFNKKFTIEYQMPKLLKYMESVDNE